MRVEERSRTCPEGETFDRETKRCRAKKTPGRKGEPKAPSASPKRKTKKEKLDEFYTQQYLNWYEQKKKMEDDLKKADEKNRLLREKEEKKAAKNALKMMNKSFF